MKINYFIFDFDGVVADTEDVFAKFDCQIISEYLAKAGFDHTIPYEEMRGLAGIPGEEKFCRICHNHNIDPEPLAESFTKERTKRRKSLFENHPVSLGKNLRQFLAQIDGRFALATNKEKHKLDNDIKVMGVDALFPTMVSCDPPLRRKPEPDVIIEAMKRLNAQPKKCAYIGDNVSDIKAAIAANVTPIGFVIDSVIDKEAHGTKLKDAGAAMIISDFTDLLPYK